MNELEKAAAICAAVAEQRNHKQVLLDALTLEIVREIDPHEWITISDTARKPKVA